MTRARGVGDYRQILSPSWNLRGQALNSSARKVIHPLYSDVCSDILLNQGCFVAEVPIIKRLNRGSDRYHTRNRSHQAATNAFKQKFITYSYEFGCVFRIGKVLPERSCNSREVAASRASWPSFRECYSS